MTSPAIQNSKILDNPKATAKTTLKEAAAMRTDLQASRSRVQNKSLNSRDKNSTQLISKSLREFSRIECKDKTRRIQTDKVPQPKLLAAN